MTWVFPGVNQIARLDCTTLDAPIARRLLLFFLVVRNLGEEAHQVFSCTGVYPNAGQNVPAKNVGI